MTQQQRKQLPTRSSRGTRINKLIGEEAEADETFWGQDAWREDDEDDDYSTEEEEEDVVDADFDEEEDPDEDVHDGDEDDNRRKRSTRGGTQRGAYREPKQTAMKKPRLTIITTAIVPERTSKVTPSTPTAFQYEAPTVRRSTARKSSESSELRKKITEDAARLAVKTKKQQQQSDVKATGAKHRLTQAQLLAEAVRTEVENIQSLSRLEQQEEEKKADSMTPKAPPFTGQMVRYHSRIGAPKTITFLNSIEFPSIFHQPKPKKRERRTEHQHRRSEEEDRDDDEHKENEEEEE